MARISEGTPANAVGFAGAELMWQGKYDESGQRTEPVRVNLPFQVIERINESRATRAAKTSVGSSLFDIWQDTGSLEDGWRNKLIWGDNQLIAASLLQSFAGKVDLVYIDPPFATGADFSFTAPIGEGDVEVDKEQSLIEEKAYRDTWGAGLGSYLSMLYSRLILIRDLLSPNGSIYIHMDPTVGHYVKVLADEVFGASSFQREIVWRIGWLSGYKTTANNWIRNHDLIYYYVRNETDFVFNKEYVPYPEGYLRRDGAEPTGRGTPIEDVWNANESEFALTKADSLDSIQIKSFSGEKTGYPTQKNESLLTRIIKASSNPGDLVVDLFAGSGTTLAVAEKLGRRWIGADLGRFAIHTSKKRLLEIANCKPFEILNLGKYERQYWQGRAFGNTSTADERSVFEYLAFVLKLYGAQPVAGLTYLHGKKGKVMIQVGMVDAPVTIEDINKALSECVQLKQKELHVLGWEWEMGLNDLMADEAKKIGVKLLLLQIPREVMEQAATNAGEVRFFELAHVEATLSQPRRLNTQVALTDFVIANTELIPPDVRSRIRKWSDYVDYWAVDWDFQGDSFTQGWVTYRTRKDRSLELKSDVHVYGKPGRYRVLVKVVDIFGNDTTRSYDQNVT